MPPGEGLGLGCSLALPFPSHHVWWGNLSPSPSAPWVWEQEWWGPSPWSVPIITSVQHWRDNGVTRAGLTPTMSPTHYSSLAVPWHLPSPCSFSSPFLGLPVLGAKAEPKPQPRGSLRWGTLTISKHNQGRDVPSAMWQGAM